MPVSISLSYESAIISYIFKNVQSIFDSVKVTGTRSKIFNEIVLKDNHLLNNVT